MIPISSMQGSRAYPRNVVLSVKCDTARGLSRFSDFVQDQLGHEVCCSPNGWTKEDCKFLPNSQLRSESPQAFPYCLGRRDLCSRFYPGEGPTPHTAASTCWRASYRWHLQRERNGEAAVMLQVVEDGELAENQRVETEIARELGVRIVQVHFNTVPGGCTLSEGAVFALLVPFSSVAGYLFPGQEARMGWFMDCTVFLLCLLGATAALAQRRAVHRRLPELLALLSAGALGRTARAEHIADPGMAFLATFLLPACGLVWLGMGGGRALLDAEAHRSLTRELLDQVILPEEVAAAHERARPSLGKGAQYLFLAAATLTSWTLAYALCMVLLLFAEQRFPKWLGLIQVCLLPQVLCLFCCLFRLWFVLVREVLLRIGFERELLDNAYMMSSPLYWPRLARSLVLQYARGVTLHQPFLDA